MHLPTVRWQVRFILAVAVGSVSATPARSAVTASASGSGGCGVTTSPSFVPLLVPMHTTTTPLPGGGISFVSECGAYDGFIFGAVRKRTKILKKVQHVLTAARRSSAAAAKRKKKPISAECAATVGTLTNQVSVAIAP